jgi:glycosyltransferase involved in cell wall biosynthesis
LLNKIKLWRWQKIICYSQFMAGIIKSKLKRQPEVLFVPVRDVKLFKIKKRNLILSVGRFFPNLHNKKQLELVYIFKGMVSNGLKNTELVLIGSVDPGGEGYLEKIKQEITGFPIKIITDAGFDKLQKLYQEAKIYWHGTGYGENLELHPEKAEHFGVVTIEAMQHGAVPVVFAGGGQTEIVQNDINGILWKNSQGLINGTKKLLHDEKYWKDLSEAAITKSQEYSQDRFCQKLKEIIK